MRIKIDLGDTHVEVEVENRPSGESMVSQSHTCASSVSARSAHSPSSSITLTQDGPPFKCQRISTLYDVNQPANRPLSAGSGNTENNDGVLEDGREGTRTDSSGLLRLNGDERQSQNVKGQENGVAEGHGVPHEHHVIYHSLVAKENEALVLYPLEVREAVKATHKRIREARAQSCSASTTSPSDHPPQAIKPLSEIFLLTQTHTSELAYKVLGAFTFVEDANMTLLELFQYNHLATVQRSSDLWRKTEYLTPPYRGVAWWIAENGALAMASDDDHPDDLVFRVMWMRLC
jgi:hypothetical protein